MRKIIAVAALGIGAIAAQAEEGAKVLSMAELDVGGVKVRLPKTQEADGSICVAYVSSASRQSDGALNMKVEKVCDRPARVEAAAPFPAEVFPAKLLAMKVVRSDDGLVIQMPVLTR